MRPASIEVALLPSSPIDRTPIGALSLFTFLTAVEKVNSDRACLFLALLRYMEHVTEKLSALSKSSSFAILLLGSLLFTGTLGCGRANKVYPDRSSVGTNTNGDDTVHIGDRTLPKNFVDQSANKGSASLTSQKDIELKVLAGANADGAFNGSGTGNLAILGLSAFNQKRLADVGTISFDSKTTLGTSKASLVLLVDLECKAVIDARALFVETPDEGGAQSDGFTRQDVKAAAAVWTVTGTDLKDGQGNTLISASQPGPLTSLLAAYPDACLRNANSQEPTLTKIPTAGLMITLGSPTTVDQAHVLIRRIEIGTQVFDSTDWGS